MIERVPAPKVAVGQPAPDFKLKTVDGKFTTLSELRGNKAAFINFFASWCPPCNAELPMIESHYSQFRDRVEFVGIDEQEELDAVVPYIKKRGVTYPVVLDWGKAQSSYRVVSLPKSIFVDKHGIVRAIWEGYLPPAAFDAKMALIAAH